MRHYIHDHYNELIKDNHIWTQDNWPPASLVAYEDFKLPNSQVADIDGLTLSKHMTTKKPYLNIELCICLRISIDAFAFCSNFCEETRDLDHGQTEYRQDNMLI